MRVRMVTRTVEQNIFSVMVVVGGKNVETVNVTLGNITGLPQKKVDELVKAQVEKENLGLFVQITGCEKKEKLFGMSETDFLKYAQELPER